MILIEERQCEKLSGLSSLFVSFKFNQEIIDIIKSTEKYSYDKKTYTIRNAENGTWVIGSSKAKILQQDDTTAYIEVTTGRSGKFELKYVRDNEEDIILNITIQSL